MPPFLEKEQLFIRLKGYWKVEVCEVRERGDCIDEVLQHRRVI